MVPKQRLTDPPVSASCKLCNLRVTIIDISTACSRWCVAAHLPAARAGRCIELLSLGCVRKHRKYILSVYRVHARPPTSCPSWIFDL